MSNKPNPIRPLNTLVTGILTIIGAIATVGSCVITFLAFVNPQAVTQTINQFYLLESPDPKTIITQQIPATTIAVIQVTSTPLGQTFYDDFELGIRPEWKILYGNVGMSQGKFTVISPYKGRREFHLALLDGADWQNFRLETEISIFDVYMQCFDCDYSAAGGIILRYSPEKSIGLLIIPGKNTLAFATLDGDQNWSIITTTVAEGWNTQDFDLRRNDNILSVEAKGNTYFAYVNGKLVTSATIDGPTSGMVGLWFQNSGSEDSLKAYAPRFDDFKIVEAH